MENIAGLWLRLKGQADKILLLGSLAFMGKNIRRIKSGGSQNLKFWLRSVMNTEQTTFYSFFFCMNILVKSNQKSVSLFIIAQKKVEVENLEQHSLN